MKTLLISGFILCLQNFVFGQELKEKKPMPFDHEKLSEQFGKLKQWHPDSFRISEDSVHVKLKDRNSIRIFSVPEKDMAKMPEMKIKEDFHYAMRIKRYNKNYPYTRQLKPRDSIPGELKLYRPLTRRQGGN